jgi:protein-disulfide isomerase
MSYDADTVDTLEKVVERSPDGKVFTLSKAYNPPLEVVTTRVQDFTCPACSEVVAEAIATNGRIRGW